MAELLRDFASGPLDFYRKKASFDWKTLKLFVYGEEEIRYMHNVYEEIKKYPEFQPLNKPLSFDEQRQLSFRQSAILRAKDKILYNTKYSQFYEFSLDTVIKYLMITKVFTGVIQGMGSKRHQKFVEQVAEGKICGCLCLTEVGHGTNLKGMETTATYTKNTKEFIIHSPTFEAAKCWAGGLGNTATHVLLYAQLYVDDRNYGLHSFVVPIRDPKTLIPYPGVTVGDMGEKMGLHGIDNGFVLFNQYHIPRENLLNKNGDVTEDGHYVSPFDDDNKRFGTSLLALSVLRFATIISSECFGAQALTIAIRYAAVRKQFGPREEEIPILEYQTHQYRLLPYLAAVYVLKVFERYISPIFISYVDDSRDGIATDDLDFLGIELHILSAAAKPVTTWIMRDTIQSCRESCGGHGYLKAARLGDLKNNQEAALTYEGENWVLIQQAINFLLKIWPNVSGDVRITVSSPLKSVNFLSDAVSILKNGRFSPRSIDDLCKPENILKIYQWLICYLLKQTYYKQQELIQNGSSNFEAKNSIQVFYGRKLGIAFIEHYFLETFLNKINDCSDPPLRPVLLNMFSLYGLFSLEKFTTVLYQGNLASGEQPALLIQDSITELCRKLKNYAVALVDVISPPDFVLNSILGASDGQVYKNIQNSLLSSPYGTGRPTWWKDIVNWKDIPNLSAKL